MIAQISITALIILPFVLGNVRVAIDFDNKAHRKTGEIRDVRTNRMLSAKSSSVNRAAS